jgi:hypothetical protein
MLKKAVFSISPGDANALAVEAPGNYLLTKEADFPFEIAFDDGDWVPFDVGMEVSSPTGPTQRRWERFKVRHAGPSAAEFVFIIGDGVNVRDGRLTISESRNGSAASFVPPLCLETVSTVGVSGVVVDTWINIAPYDAGREEIWLYTDAAALAYWGLASGATESPARNIKAATVDGRWVKLRTKASIWIKHKEAGKSVTALTFAY